MSNKPANHKTELKYKASTTQSDDTLVDIVNSQEYRDTLDYVKGNNNPPLAKPKKADKGSKPANMATNQGDIDKPAREYADKQSNPRSLDIKMEFAAANPDMGIDHSIAAKQARSLDIKMEFAAANPDMGIDHSIAAKQDDTSKRYIELPDFLTDHQYQINGTGAQVDMLSHACEVMARINMGQVNAIIDTLELKDDIDTYALQQQLEQVIQPYLKRRIPHSSYFTMHQTLRHRRSWDIRPEGGMTVNFDEPLILTDDPLLSITKLPLGLTQEIFIGQPANILSAHIDESGTAYINQCKIDDLTLCSDGYASFVPNTFQYPIGRGFNTDNWQASPIDRVF